MEKTEDKISRIAEDIGRLKENNRIARAILEASFPMDVLVKLQKILSHE